MSENKVLAFIQEFTERVGIPPSRREIMEGCQMSSTSMVQRALHQLEQAGKIELIEGDIYKLSRGIRVIQMADKVIQHDG